MFLLDGHQRLIQQGLVLVKSVLLEHHRFLMLFLYLWSSMILLLLNICSTKSEVDTLIVIVCSTSQWRLMKVAQLVTINWTLRCSIILVMRWLLLHQVLVTHTTNCCHGSRLWIAWRLSFRSEIFIFIDVFYKCRSWSAIPVAASSRRILLIIAHVEDDLSLLESEFQFLDLLSKLLTFKCELRPLLFESWDLSFEFLVLVLDLRVAGCPLAF
jgi:hypothetical protein